MVMASYATIKSLEKCEHSLRNTHTHTKTMHFTKNLAQRDFTIELQKKTFATVLHQKHV